MNQRMIYLLIESILQNSNASKQRLGQRFATHLGLISGPKGKDDGVDGWIEKDGRKIHFQSKLRSERLSVEDAKEYFSDILFHKADISVLLSGVGYKDTFSDRLFGHPETAAVDIHLLELRDVFEASEKFRRACAVLPALRFLDDDIRRQIG